MLDVTESTIANSLAIGAFEWGLAVFHNDAEIELC